MSLPQVGLAVGDTAEEIEKATFTRTKLQVGAKRFRDTEGRERRREGEREGGRERREGGREREREGEGEGKGERDGRVVRLLIYHFGLLRWTSFLSWRPCPHS